MTQKTGQTEETIRMQLGDVKRMENPEKRVKETEDTVRKLKIVKLPFTTKFSHKQAVELGGSY